MNRQKWFNDHINMRIYRNQLKGLDKKVYKEGVIITDLQHARFVYLCEKGANEGGHNLKYFDSITERDKFEIAIKKS